MRGLQNRSFFQLRTEDKLLIAHPGGSEPQRGWSAVGAESTSCLYRKGFLKSSMMEDLKDARASQTTCSIQRYALTCQGTLRSRTTD